jgi:hypothetical protein
MHIGSMLVVLAISIFLVAFISQPFSSASGDFSAVIEQRVAEIRKRSEGKESRFCTQCGHQLKPDDRFCAQCGKPVEESK